jgi:hypothetical protein
MHRRVDQKEIVLEELMAQYFYEPYLSWEEGSSIPSVFLPY